MANAFAASCPPAPGRVSVPSAGVVGLIPGLGSERVLVVGVSAHAVAAAGTPRRARRREHRTRSDGRSLTKTGAAAAAAAEAAAVVLRAGGRCMCFTRAAGGEEAMLRGRTLRRRPRARMRIGVRRERGCGGGGAVGVGGIAKGGRRMKSIGKLSNWFQRETVGGFSSPTHCLNELTQRTAHYSHAPHAHHIRGPVHCPRGQAYHHWPACPPRQEEQEPTREGPQRLLRHHARPQEGAHPHAEAHADAGLLHPGEGWRSLALPELPAAPLGGPPQALGLPAQPVGEGERAAACRCARRASRAAGRCAGGRALLQERRRPARAVACCGGGRGGAWARPRRRGAWLTG